MNENGLSEHSLLFVHATKFAITATVSHFARTTFVMTLFTSFWRRVRALCCERGLKQQLSLTVSKVFHNPKRGRCLAFTSSHVSWRQICKQVASRQLYPRYLACNST